MRLSHYFRKPLFLILAFFGATQSLCAEYMLKIQLRPHLFSTYYDVFSDEEYISSVKRQHLQLNKIYSVRDKKGEYARGIAKLLSLGTLSKSLREIKLYNEFDQFTGSIKGRFSMSENEKFTFLNSRKKTIASAIVDSSGISVKIISSTGENHPIAFFRRCFVAGGKEPFWEIKILDQDALDPSMLYVFAAYIIDTYWPSELKSEKAPSWESLQYLEIMREYSC